MADRCRGSMLLTIVGWLLLAAPARATINMTGRWILTGTQSPATFTQTGTALTETTTAGTRTGTIDSTTGAFSASDPIPCQPLFGPEQCGLSGTVAADGLTLTGEFGCFEAGVNSCMLVLGPVPVSGWFSPSTCGDGVLDSGEQCDDGNNDPRDCCDPGCRFSAAGTRCNTDPNICTDPRTCDGAGACVTPTCKVPAVAGAGRLGVSGSAGTLHWKWAKGQATSLAEFGNPVTTDDYTLCLVDESGPTPQAVASPTVIQAATGWRSHGSHGFTYRNPLAGVTRVTLKPGLDGKAAISLTTPNGPTLPLPLPFGVRLYGPGGCWGATYAAGGVRTSTATHFVGTSAP